MFDRKLELGSNCELFETHLCGYLDRPVSPAQHPQFLDLGKFRTAINDSEFNNRFQKLILAKIGKIPWGRKRARKNLECQILNIPQTLRRAEEFLHSIELQANPGKSRRGLCVVVGIPIVFQARMLPWSGGQLHFVSSPSDCSQQVVIWISKDALF